MNKTINLLFLLVFFQNPTFTKQYPIYKQCDPQWGEESLGTSDTTICSSGSLITSVAMGLSKTGSNYTPLTLNKWLTENNGYVNGDLFVWASVNELGLTFQGKVLNSDIRSKIDQNLIVICSVHSGKSWALITGYSGDNIIVNDPLYETSSYPLSDLADGQNGVYRITEKNQDSKKQKILVKL